MSRISNARDYYYYLARIEFLEAQHVLTPAEENEFAMLNHYLTEYELRHAEPRSFTSKFTSKNEAAAARA